MLAALLIIIFIALLVSAYNQYSITLSTAGLVDATSSITNHIVLDDLAHESGGNVQEYVIDNSKISLLDNSMEVGGENFKFQLTLFYYSPEEKPTVWPLDQTPPEGRAVCTVLVPVVLYESNRLEPAKLEVKVWRA